MTNEKVSKIFLKKTAESREMVQDLRRAKSSADISGKNVVLYKFCKEVQHDYKFRKVHAEIAKALQQIIDDKCNRLIIQVPPRIGKSYLASKLFPAAYLRQHPDRNVGIISYSAELAEGFSRAAREYYRESGGSLNQYKQAVNDWVLKLVVDCGVLVWVALLRVDRAICSLSMIQSRIAKTLTAQKLWKNFGTSIRRLFTLDLSRK